eukprot:6478784-Pyramimonas_sp.AAC.2
MQRLIYIPSLTYYPNDHGVHIEKSDALTILNVSTRKQRQDHAAAFFLLQRKGTWNAAKRGNPPSSHRHAPALGICSSVSPPVPQRQLLTSEQRALVRCLRGGHNGCNEILESTVYHAANALPALRLAETRPKCF